MPSPKTPARSPDGAPIAWTSAGRGSPAALLTDGIGCAGYVWRRLAPELAKERRVLHWNYRGHGRSPPPPDLSGATVERAAEDLVSVLDAAGEDRAVLFGHSMGVQVALEAQRRAPERVAGLVLVCGAPGRLIDTFHDSGVLKVVFPWARAVFERFPQFAAAAFRASVTSEVAMEYALAFEVNRALVDRDDLQRYFDDLGQVDPAVFVRLLESAAAHDATGYLPDVTAPTLVVAGERDGFTPVRLSVALHQAIPGSELLVLPGGTHIAPLEHADVFAERVQAFLAARCPVVRPRRRAPARRPAPRRTATRPAKTTTRRTAATRRAR